MERLLCANSNIAFRKVLAKIKLASDFPTLKKK